MVAAGAAGTGGDGASVAADCGPDAGAAADGAICVRPERSAAAGVLRWVFRRLAGRWCGRRV